MNPVRKAPLLAAAWLVAAGCTAPAGAPPSTPSPSPSASAQAPTSPGPMPSAAATPTPVPTPAGPPLPEMASGRLLRDYAFKGIASLHLDPAGEVLHVIDGTTTDVPPKGYLLRRFSRDGAFEVAIPLRKEDEEAPDAVDGFVFGAYGTPFYLHRLDERLVLRRLYTATSRDAADFPSHFTPRVGTAALLAEGAVLTLATLRYDPEEKSAKTTNQRAITYVRADPERDPQAIFQLPDPLSPTRKMVLGPGGLLYLLGATAAGRLEAKQLDAKQQLSDLPLGLERMPDRLTVDPAGRLWLFYDSTGSEAATLAVHDASGALLRRQPITLADGARVFRVRGVTFDKAGAPLLGGDAIYPDLRTVQGIFEFPAPR